ncbi:MAG: SPOCS domain-containing protein [Butyricicoccus sp.]
MELTKTTLQWSRPLLDCLHTYEESADAIVPDTFPDILRVSAAYGAVQLKDDAPQSGRVLVSGSIPITVLYVPEDGGLRRLTVPISFAHIEEGPGITEDSQIFVTCQVVNASAHVMNSRKLSVSAILSIHCCVFAQEELSLTDGIADSDNHLELLTTSHTITVPAAVQRREFTMMDDLDLPEAGRFAELFAPACDLRMTECRILNGKAVLKGECLLHFLGLTPEQAIEPLNTSMSFTQIFDVPDFNDNHPVSVRFSLRHLDTELQDEGQVSVGMGINVLLTAFSTHTLQSIADVYHLQYPVQAEMQAVEIPGCHPLNEFGCEASETIPVGMKVVSVVHACASPDTILQEESRTVLRMMATILYRSDDGEYYSISRAVHMPLHLPDGTGPVQVTGTICRASATVSGENSVVLSLSARCSLLCEEPLRISDITRLELDTTAVPERIPVSVILRYVDKEERLWDIAKHYHTTVDAIRQANRLGNEDCCSSSQMLLIPVR